MSGELEDVYLSRLSFARTPSNPQSSSTTKSPTTEPASSGSSHSKLHEHLATERIGEELLPDAKIWGLYLEEAKEYDNELVDGQNKNLDVMLLFAALFSAILSAFLIQSNNLLQQDPANASVTLLLLIAQSQQRIEQSTPQLDSAPIELPNFSVPLSARWINGLWFLALALSLSAALVAMLAKEWLTAFTASRPRPAHTWALLRQARLAGLTEWHALLIIDLLPSMLHLSLFLFGAGLVLYLWNLDLGIALVIALVTLATLLFYIWTAVLGAVHEFCPFVTKVSKSMKVLNRYARAWMLRKGYMSTHTEQPSDYTTDKDIRALAWLIDNARDPAIIDYTYMSLTGLRLSTFKPGTRSSVEEELRPPSRAGSVNLGATSSGDAAITRTHEGLDSPFSQNILVRGLFDGLCTRLSQALSQHPRELAARQGVNVARYACALPQMVQLLESYSDPKLVGRSRGETETKSIYKAPAQAAFEALDVIWCNECPSLSPDSYALLTSAELRLTTVTVASYAKQYPLQYNAPETKRLELSQPACASSNKGANPNQSHVEVPVESMEKPHGSSQVSLFDLRARYSRALSRAAYLLHYHAQGRAPIGVDALIHTLNSIREAAQCDDLNPMTHLSTHQPQSRKGQAPRIFVRVAGMYGHLHVDPNSIGDEYGLLVGLLRLLASPEAQSNSALGYAAGDALRVITPILLKQWSNLHSADGRTAEPLPEIALRNWPLPRVTTDWQSELALRLSIVAVSQTRQELPEQAICAWYTRLKTNPNRLQAFVAFCLQEELRNQLIALVDTHIKFLNQSTLRVLVSVFLVDYQNQTYFQWPGISIKQIPAFLRIMSKVPGQAPELQTLLAVLQDKIQTHMPYLQLFTNSDGFSALLKVGEHAEYRLIVAKCVMRIIERATETDNFIAAQTAPEFFDAISIALEALASQKDGAKSLLASACKLLPSLRSFPHATLHNIATRPAVTAVYRAWQSINELTEKQANLLSDLEEMQCWLYADSLPLEGLAPLFEQGQGAEGAF